ncbi:MAG TPA: outer membrane beta-barrel protein [Vicinamibacterales bacterium]|nr:outer membrane beta-barrel protein [Vicinamibacterales bacterium]
MHRLTFTFMLTMFVLVSGAHAQSLNPGPPGPFVFDLRALTTNLPSDEVLFPELAADATVPARGFGGSAGGHVYAFQIGPGRLGLGVDVLFARGSTVDANSSMTSVDPQISMNFGTSEGWSTLSAGVGVTRISADPGGVSESVRSINWGGGARWFITPHLGIGFDIRIHHLAAGDVLPKSTAVSIGAGLSLK